MGPHAPARSGRHGDTGRLRATSLFFARSLSTWSPETGPPKPASAAGARRLPGTTPTCSKSSHAKLMREPCGTGRVEAEIRGKLAELVEKRVAAEDQLKRVDIRAPQDGV